MSPSTEGLHKLCVLWMCLLAYSQVQASPDCPEGFAKHYGKCYTTMNESFNWFAAQVACWSMGARLVEIDTPEKNSLVTNFLRLHGVYQGWIGVTSFAERGVFRHCSTREELPDDVSDYWESGQPKNRTGEECVLIRNSGRWLDSSCSGTIVAAVCEIAFDD